MTCLTPQSGHMMRGVRACRNAWCWKKSRWRHSTIAVSCDLPVGRAAVRAGETAATCEVELDVEALGDGIEAAGLHQPRRHQGQSHLHQVGVAHGCLLSPIRTKPAIALTAVKDKPSAA